MKIVGRRSAFTAAKQAQKPEEDTPKFAYRSWPKVEFSISKYADLAGKRIQALKYLEERVALNRELRDDTVFEKLKAWGVFTANTDDIISHMLCRLGYCRTKEKRDWFLLQEKRLFEIRWDRASSRHRRIILGYLHDSEDYVEIDKKHAIQLGMSGMFPLPQMSLEYELPGEEELFPIHKVRFEFVPDLVANHMVLLKSGYAYVPDRLFQTYVSGRFRAKLSASLMLAYKRFAQRPGEFCERILPIIKSMERISSGPVYKADEGDKLRPKEVKSARNFFPLCMRVLEKQLRADSHLKHQGRLTYGKFLKGAGMTCDDQIAYYRSHFTKKMSAEKFMSEYKYMIRHHYGLEGKKKNYGPLGCMAIAMMPVGQGEYHGCPFKYFDEKNLVKLLREARVSDAAQKAILEKAKDNHIHLACRDTFAETFKKELKANDRTVDDYQHGWQHPNGYYRAAKELCQGKNSKPQTAFDKMQTG